jgi:hypothetical protein
MVVAHWTYTNALGAWSIARGDDGRWHPMFGNESLGSFHCPEAALGSLCIGAVWFPKNGLDPATAALPDSLEAWTPQKVSA